MAGQMLMHHFDGCWSLEINMFTTKDLSHSSKAKYSLNAIVTKSLTDHGLRRFVGLMLGIARVSMLAQLGTWLNTVPLRPFFC